MDDKNELFGELHEQEENGLFGNEHTRQNEAQQPAITYSTGCMPLILDPCSGGRQFWFNKSNPDVLFCDIRVMEPKVVGSGKNARIRKCLPDRVMDFRKMDLPDKTFRLVVFDPPHLFLGENSFMAQSYGRLDKQTWKDDLRRGFAECFRVLKDEGILIFKWNEYDVPLKEVLALTDNKPLFGHPSGKAQKTHWVTFMKRSTNNNNPTH